ncbi:MAG: hypothetical protein HYY97_04440 [Rhodocyclales bacterium]|nr:hypothetical protein [Rhodocyclales bacterium]
MNKNAMRLLAVSAAYFALSSAYAADAVTGTTTTTTTSTSGSADPVVATAAMPASRIASRFESLAGSPENAASLVAGLRSGTEITLSAPDSTTGISFTPTTRPMGYGNITQALSLAQRQLAAQGITEPTPEQLQIALNGGTVTRIDSSGATQTVEVPGVLQLRSQGMGWGQIAHELSVSPGNRPLTTSGVSGTGTSATETSGTAATSGSSGTGTSATAGTSATTRTQGSSSARLGYGGGAIVSGDGSMVHGRAPGYSSVAQTRTEVQTRGQVQAQSHSRAPVIQASGASSIVGSASLGMGNGKGPAPGRGNGRF